MIQFSITEIFSWLGVYIWPFIRIGAFFLAAPIIGSRLLPARIRLLLALAVTALVATRIQNVPKIDPISLQALVLIAKEVAVGFAMALVLQMLFHIAVLAGQLIAMQAGLGFASMVDPVNGISVPTVAQFYLTLCYMLFLNMNGHLWVVQYIANSFDYVALAQGFPLQHWQDLVNTASWMFSSALLVALPAVVSLLMVNVAFGVMGRVAPQMNIMNVGFAMITVFGFFVMLLSIGHWVPEFDRFNREAMAILLSLLKS